MLLGANGGRVGPAWIAGFEFVTIPELMRAARRS